MYVGFTITASIRSRAAWTTLLGLALRDRVRVDQPLGVEVPGRGLVARPAVRREPDRDHRRRVDEARHARGDRRLDHVRGAGDVRRGHLRRHLALDADRRRAVEHALDARERARQRPAEPRSASRHSIGRSARCVDLRPARRVATTWCPAAISSAARFPPSRPLAPVMTTRDMRVSLPAFCRVDLATRPATGQAVPDATRGDAVRAAFACGKKIGMLGEMLLEMNRSAGKIGDTHRLQSMGVLPAHPQRTSFVASPSQLQDCS